MDEQRITIDSNEVDVLKNINELLKNYDPEKESVVLMKISGQNTLNLQTASSVKAIHIPAYKQEFETFIKTRLNDLAEKSPLHAAIMLMVLKENEKND